MFIKDEGDGFFQKLNPFEEVSYLQQMVDRLIYFALSFGYFPIIQRAPDKAKNFIDNSLDIIRKTLLSSLLAFVVLMSKCHLKEVNSKELHEEKETEKSREYSSNIGKNIKDLEIVPFDLPSHR